MYNFFDGRKRLSNIKVGHIIELIFYLFSMIDKKISQSEIVLSGAKVMKKFLKMMIQYILYFNLIFSDLIIAIFFINVLNVYVILSRLIKLYYYLHAYFYLKFTLK